LTQDENFHPRPQKKTKIKRKSSIEDQKKTKGKESSRSNIGRKQKKIYVKVFGLDNI